MNFIWIFVIVFVILGLTSGSGAAYRRRRSNNSGFNNGGDPSNTFETNKTVWQYNANKAVKIPYYEFTEIYNEFPYLSDYAKTVEFIDKNKSIHRDEINNLVDRLNAHESIILRQWESEQHKLLMAFDRAMLGTSPQMITFLLQYYNVWLDSFKELMISHFIKNVVPAEIGTTLGDKPQDVIKSASFSKTIRMTMENLQMNFSTATDALIQRLFQEVQYGRMFNNEQQFQQFQQAQQNNQQKYKSNFSEDFNEVNQAYKILKMNQECTDEDLKKSYRKLAMEFHPDRNSSEKAKNEMSKINAAYDLIKKIRNIK